MTKPLAHPRRRVRRALKGLTMFLGMVLGLLWYIGVVGGNVREVDPGLYYRSAQLSGATLDRVVREDQIKSIINLRGAQPGEAAYDSEMAISRSRGIAHSDFDMSAYRLPLPTEIGGVIKALDRLPRPVLVHCRGGSDRTGLVSTLYLNLYKGVPLDRAESEELTWRYGHLSFSSSRAMDRFFDLYRSTSKGQDMRTWIFSTYPAVYAEQVRLHAPDVAAPARKE